MRFGRRLVAAAFVAALVPVAGCESPPPPPSGPDPWPDVLCGAQQTHAITLLFQIEEAAIKAHLALSLSTEERDWIISQVHKCRTNQAPYPCPPDNCKAEHCGHVLVARNAAWMGNWELCRNELEHGH